MKTSLVRLDFRDLTVAPAPLNLYKDAGSNYKIKFIEHVEHYFVFYEHTETAFNLIIWDTKNTTPGYAGDPLTNLPTETHTFTSIVGMGVSQ